MPAAVLSRSVTSARLRHAQYPGSALCSASDREEQARVTDEAGYLGQAWLFGINSDVDVVHAMPNRCLTDADDQCVL
jgi:hypothetical protein